MTLSINDLNIFSVSYTIPNVSRRFDEAWGREVTVSESGMMLVTTTSAGSARKAVEAALPNAEIKQTRKVGSP